MTSYSFLRNSAYTATEININPIIINATTIAKLFTTVYNLINNTIRINAIPRYITKFSFLINPYTIYNNEITASNIIDLVPSERLMKK